MLHSLSAQPRFSSRIAVIKQNTPSGCDDSTDKIIEAAKARGHEVEVFNPDDTSLVLGQRGEIHAHGKVFTKDAFDIVIPRIDSEDDPNIANHSFALLRQFQSMGIPALNKARHIENANDKLRTHQILAGANIPTTPTFFSLNPNHFSSLLLRAKDFVVKGVQGSKGDGVEKVTRDQLIPKLEKHGLEKEYNLPIVQPFVDSAKNTDFRFYVTLGADGKRHVVGGMKRIAAAGDFRANASIPGSTQKILSDQEITVDDKKLAIDAAKAMKLDIAGIDVLKTAKGSEVLEVNSTPAFKFFNSASGKNLAKDIIDAAEAKIKLHKEKQLQKKT